MRNPTVEDCHPNNCSDNEQQLARIIRLWVNDPDGVFDTHQSIRERLCCALEHRIQSWLSYSSDTSIHEFWSDGLHLRSAQGNASKAHFTGTSIYSDRHANKMWIAPFDIFINYVSEAAEWPATLSLRFGIPDASVRIARIKPRSWETWRSDGDEIFQDLPQNDRDWAIVLDLDPFPDRPKIVAELPPHSG